MEEEHGSGHYWKLGDLRIRGGTWFIEKLVPSEDDTEEDRWLVLGEFLSEESASEAMRRQEEK